jgi:MFS family permease
MGRHDPEPARVKPAPAFRPCRRLPWPKRVDISLLCFVALVIAYCDRVNVSVAAPSIMKEYGWDTARMGWALTAFFIGYTLFMIPAGILTHRYGPKRVFAFSIGWWSVFTAITPLPGGLAGLAAMRVVMGAGESGTIPSINSILVRWFPAQEYSRVTAFCWSGGYAGSIVAFPIAAAILDAWGWRAIFYVFAALGALWIPLWLAAATDWPEDFRTITRAELDHIRAGRPDLRVRGSVPWRELLACRPLWGVLALHFSSNWFFYVMISWLPTYLILARHFSLANMGFGASLPFLSALVGTNVFGLAIDRLSRGRNRTRVRKWFLLPFALAAAILLLLPAAPGPVAIVCLLCAAMALLTGATPVYASNSLDIAPRYAGTVVAVQNSFANVAGVLAPVTVGYVVKAAGWPAAFWLTAAVCGAGIIAFLVFGSADRLLQS